MYIEKEFVDKIHWFLKEIRKRNVNIENKRNLYNIITTLKSRTDNQRRRFALYYGLAINENKALSLTEIAKLDNCSVPAVRSSIVRIRNTIPMIKGIEKERILQIIKDMEEGKLWC